MDFYMHSPRTPSVAKKQKGETREKGRKIDVE
jgi:hypothetical protein